MRLEKYASKTERSGTLVPVGIGTDEDTRSLVVYQFTYKTTNLINGKIYIGAHSTDNIKSKFRKT